MIQHQHILISSAGLLDGSALVYSGSFTLSQKEKKKHKKSPATKSERKKNASSFLQTKLLRLSRIFSLVPILHLTIAARLDFGNLCTTFSKCSSFFGSVSMRKRWTYTRFQFSHWILSKTLKFVVPKIDEKDKSENEKKIAALFTTGVDMCECAEHCAIFTRKKTLLQTARRTHMHRVTHFSRSKMATNCILFEKWIYT